MIQNSLFIIMWCAHIILESLPISSSGHIAFLTHLLTRFTHMRIPAVSTTMMHLMHIPTLFVISAYLFHFNIFNAIGRNPASFFHWLVLIAIANGITFLFYEIKKKWGFGDYTWLRFGFLFSAIALRSLTYAPMPTNTTITFLGAVIIGLAQAFSLLPGVSRLALTFVAATWVGILPLSAMLFSLTIEFVLILGAVAKALYDVYRKKASFPKLPFFGYILVTLASIIAYLALLWVTQLAISGSIALFGIYLLALSVIVYLIK